MKPKPKRKARAAADPTTESPSESRDPDYLWSGKPVFRCRRMEWCRFERVGDLVAVLRHEARHQPIPGRTSKEKK